MLRGMCVHYTQDVAYGGECGAGVNVRALTGGEDFGWLVRTPCLGRNEADVVCDARQEPTEEELREWRRRLAATMQGLGLETDASGDASGAGEADNG